MPEDLGALVIRFSAAASLSWLARLKLFKSALLEVLILDSLVYGTVNLGFFSFLLRLLSRPLDFRVGSLRLMKHFLDVLSSSLVFLVRLYEHQLGLRLLLGIPHEFCS